MSKPLPARMTREWTNRDYGFPPGAKFRVVKLPDPNLVAPRGVAIYHGEQLCKEWAEAFNRHQKWTYSLTFSTETQARNWPGKGYGVAFVEEPTVNEWGEVSP